ncbi:MAG: WG repeat-containing protein, partial [Bacteroidota bacterium]
KTTTLKISQYLDFRDLGEIIVFEQVNGETIITKNGRKMDRREYEDMIEEIKAREKELFIQEIPEEEIRTEFTGSGRDRILEVLEYGQSALEYGFINENGEIILPVEYDKMIFDEDNIEIELYKNGKVGRMILFSPYSVIDAQYDQVFYGKILKTSRDRYFTVFKIKQGTNYGYVGENGVEYFRF